MMSTHQNTFKLASIAAVVVTMAGCASHNSSGTESGSSSQGQLSKREAAVAEREQAIVLRESQFNQKMSGQATGAGGLSMPDSLLPPGATAGECYARVWVPGTFENEKVIVKTNDASEIINEIPAEYRWVEKSVVVTEASSRLEVSPAVYGSKAETIKIKDERTIWMTNLGRDAAPASDKMLASVAASGINLDSTQPGTCYQEHFKPAQYRTVTDKILVSEASASYSTIAAEYENVEQRVLVSEASTRIVQVPAVYESASEVIVDVPAHTIWKKGRGPIQRIDEGTGEIMCLVDVPATYKTIQKRILKSPATTRTIDIPAKYETISVRRQTSAPQTVSNPIPAKYSNIARSELIKDAEFVWHDVSNKAMSSQSRTGAKICLVNEPAQYKTVMRQTVITPAVTRTVSIPATYKKIQVKELVTAASEKRTLVPAIYKTVTTKKVASNGRMEWRSILCETNMTHLRISEIQQALKGKGFYRGPIDGVIGKQTIAAVNSFQLENNLPVDKYLNVKTLDALGIAAN
jgi:hypothetical protein